MSNDQEQLRHLRSLHNDTLAQVEYALVIISNAASQKRRKDTNRRELLQAALRVLANAADEASDDVDDTTGDRVGDRVALPETREALLTLYQDYTSRGETSDPGAYMRAALLRALRPSLHPTDTEMLLRAVTTYEFLPPGFDEEAVPLRAIAIVALNEVDDQLARFHAARLLGDQYIEPMSGEPALSAARVLGVQGEILLLYYYAMQHAPASLSPEVIAECLRHLITLPQSLLPTLVERYRESEHKIILAGLFDLLLAHDEGPHERDFLLDFLAKTTEYDIYQYLITLLVARVASGRPAFLDALLETVQAESDPEKALIAYNAFSILPPDDRISSLLKLLESRL